MRTQIETLFGFLKTKGFDFEDTHNIHSRLHNLLSVLTIAFCLAYKAGLIAVRQTAPKLKTHNRLAKSIFRVGLDALRESEINIKRSISKFLKAIFIYTL